GLTVGPLIVDSHVRKNMEKALERVKSGEFAETWTGNPRAYDILSDLMNKMAQHPIEKVGEKIRKMANI
ncbi:MAG: hypothetical protein QW223_06445, partial [Candidatus Caldarchaeum sp.]